MCIRDRLHAVYSPFHQEQQKVECRQEAQEEERWQKEEHKQETEEGKHETDDTKVLIQAWKQMQEHTAGELSLLRGELNNQITRISDIEESMSNKISDVEETVATIKLSIANIKVQIKNEIELLMKIQPWI